ncbi:MAG: hypothetical protein V7K88_21770 [Nostoc sp.]|uniref:hypothetical protein n=1 Tax=Nostoc sp. TaxID=1180 RepID=UPI002FF70B29
MVTHILKVNEHGDLYLASEVLEEIQPGTVYSLEVQGDVLILRPERSGVLSPEEKAAKWRRWAASHSANSPVLPDEALRRENIYD